MQPWLREACWKHDFNCMVNFLFSRLAVEMHGKCLYVPRHAVACMHAMLLG